MAVSEDEKKMMAQAIQLKRQLARLKGQIDRELKSQVGPNASLGGRPLDPDSLPAGIREKYLLYQSTAQELAELRRNASAAVRSLIDPQIAC